jgi:hypothetical protein
MLRFLTQLFKSTPPIANNKTRGVLSDFYIAAQWKAAQDKLGKGLTAEEAKHFRVAPLTPFPRALNCWPGGVDVYCVPDMLYSDFLAKCAEVGVTPKTVTGDPTGTFYAGGKRFLTGQTTYSLWSGTDVKFVRSRPYVLTHEFMHVILHRLGAA